MEFRVHWFAVTIWGSVDYALKLWDEWFSEYFGEMIQTGHGGRGFKLLFSTLAAAKLYANPVSDDEYFHIELPGTACDAIPPKVLQEFMIVLDRYDRFRVTRLDLAWDGVPFTPKQFRNSVENEEIRSLAKRNTLSYWTNPFDERDDGEIGTSSVKIGSRQSSRMVRVYDKRGPVRLEFQSKQERSDLIARDILLLNPEDWPEKSIAHLRDYLDLEIDEWVDFVGEVGRANQIVSDPKQIELDRIVGWIHKQVSPALSVLVDVIGEQAVDAFIVDGRRKRGKRYKPLLVGI